MDHLATDDRAAVWSIMIDVIHWHGWRGRHGRNGLDGKKGQNGESGQGMEPR